MDTFLIEDRVKKIAEEVFKINSFKELQKDIILSILNKNDTLAIFPTGGGKSITFQIPALIFEGLTIVVTPLISLMKDQVRILKEERNIMECDYISSSRKPEEIHSIYNNIDKLRILYVSPERLENRYLLKVLKEKRIDVSMITADEAHCISLWGNTFRHSYLRIGDFINQFPNAVISAFTATATPEIISDIIHHLGMERVRIIQKSLKRDDLFLCIKFVEEKIKFILDALKPDLPTIIYTTSKYMCNHLSYILQAHGFSSTIYHAGLSGEEREKNQSEFVNGTKNIIVATSAFGMGIDKKDIRKVIHFSPPLEIEEYFQEIGRAGRDGLGAEALILVNMDDYEAMESMITDNYPEWKIIKRWTIKKNLRDTEREKLVSVMNFLGIEDMMQIKKFKKEYIRKKKIELKKADVMKMFISASACRTAFIQNYFGEKAEDCGKCDYCLEKKVKLSDLNLSEIEIKLLSCMGKYASKIDIKSLRETVIGLKNSFAVNKGFSVLKGVDIRSYYESIYSLKNKNMIEFDEHLNIRILPFQRLIT